MSLHKGLLFAMLFAIVALAEPGRVNVLQGGICCPEPEYVVARCSPCHCGIALVRQLADKQAKSMAQGIPQERRIAARDISSDPIQEPQRFRYWKVARR